MINNFYFQNSHREKNNNFDNVRLSLALIVFFSHAVGLSNESNLAVFSRFFDANFAVKGFFVISGYLIYQSYIKSHSFIDYLEKRIRRIYPAYVLAISICLLIGILTSSLGWINILISHKTIDYVLSNLIFMNFIQPTLPGVFEGNLVQALNGSLWTIKVELMLYACVPIIAYLFKKINPVLNYLCILCIGSLWVFYFEEISAFSFRAEIARQFPGQLPYFVFGSLIAANPKFIKWLPQIAILGFFTLVLTDNYTLSLCIRPLAFGAIVLSLCMLNPSKLNIGRAGDLSYGIYLFHFPIVQLMVNMGVYKYNPYLGLLTTFVLTVLLSFISWHFVEKRFLKRNSHYLELNAR